MAVYVVRKGCVAKGTNSVADTAALATSPVMSGIIQCLPSANSMKLRCNAIHAKSNTDEQTNANMKAALEYRNIHNEQIPNDA